MPNGAGAWAGLIASGRCSRRSPAWVPATACRDREAIGVGEQRRGPLPPPYRCGRGGSAPPTTHATTPSNTPASPALRISRASSRARLARLARRRAVHAPAGCAKGARRRCSAWPCAGALDGRRRGAGRAGRLRGEPSSARPASCSTTCCAPWACRAAPGRRSGRSTSPTRSSAGRRPTATRSREELAQCEPFLSADRAGAAAPHPGDGPLRRAVAARAATEPIGRLRGRVHATRGAARS